MINQKIIYLERKMIMTKKIFINCPHGGKDSGAVYGNLYEKNLAFDICMNIINELSLGYKDIHVKMFRDNDSYYTLERICRESNNFGADIFVSPHVNAGGGTGFESFIFNGSVSNTTKNNQKTIHSSIMKELSKYNVRDRGMKKANFYVLRNTKAPALLTENMFIDTKSDRDLLTNSSFIKDVAMGHVNGIVKALGLEKKEILNNSDTFYRVVTGSFKDRENAERRIVELKDKGFSSFIDIYKG